MYIARNKRKKHHKAGFLLIGIVAITVLVAIIILKLNSNKPNNKEFLYKGIAADINATIYNKDWQKDFNSDQSFAYSYNKTPKVNGGNINVNLINPKENNLLMICELVLPNGETLGNTSYIPPGYQIKTINLEDGAEVSSEDALLYVYAVSVEDLEIISEASHQIILDIK